MYRDLSRLVLRFRYARLRQFYLESPRFVWNLVSLQQIPEHSGPRADSLRCRAYFPMAALSFYSLLSFQCNSKVPWCPKSAIARNYEAFHVGANAFVCCGACACCSLISCGRHAKAFACHWAPTVTRRQVGGIYGGASRCYEESIGEKYLAGPGEWW